ncbi:F-box/kelch-repeat protein [Rhynchospora pubera]|uniref:F-box/kelch-repeat protein n=1 Tax=Rhynchospora pubera TaxID=906938 RepID=A0AAV8C1H8_9POAL|nr:F-box/kelch-repeat protein [Rhynchospora pubera]
MVDTDTSTVMNHPNNSMICTDLPADMLEAVVTKLPTVDLLSASCVSHGWLHAVHSSLHTQPRLFPWLILRCLPHPVATTHWIHALDPHSRTWLSVPPHYNSTGKAKEPSPTLNFLHGSTRDRLYALTLSQLLISEDPFGCSCQMEAKGPNVWRQDPVVAEVQGQWVVVVGGGFLTDDREEEGAVEVYDKETGMWELAEPMPAEFDRSTYATWLSVAVSEKRLFVIEKKTGWVSRFDPESKKWGPTCQLRTVPSVSKWAIVMAGKERLLLVGAGAEGEMPTEMKVRAWEVDGDSLQVINNKAMEMPAEMVDRLFPNFDSLDEARRQVCSVEVCGTEHGGYMFDPASMKNGVVMHQLQQSMEDQETGRVEMRWEWVPSPESVGRGLKESVAVGCSPVLLHQVARTRCFQS